MIDVDGKFNYLPLFGNSLVTLPNSIGVYIFKNKKQILYIGKSTNIKARISSHMESAKIDAKENAITRNADTIGYYLCDSEFKALLLESSLISNYKPKYNSRWRDDKSYLYIKIIDDTSYPKIVPTRKPKDFDKITKSSIFGPFPSMTSVVQLMREIRKIIPYCSQKKISKASCFYSKIGLCNPCPNNIEKINNLKIRNKLKALYKRNINLIKKTLSGHSELVLREFYRQLKKLKKNQKYEEAIDVRNKIIRFEKLLYDAQFSNEESLLNSSTEALKSLNGFLSKYFRIKNNLERIECYDVSNLAFDQPSASMTVLNNGHVDKSKYRRFKIKRKRDLSDFNMIEEVLKRRFNNKWRNPDLILVDGGRPQVETVKKTLENLSKNIPVVGIAKHPDRLILSINGSYTIRPDYHDLGFNLLRRLRDESHRFARKYHLFLRAKKLKEKMI